MADEKQLPKPKRKAVTEDTLLLGVIKRYFKYAGAAIAIWGFGYYQFSPAWILLGLVVVTWKEKHNKLQQRKIEISQHAAKNEKEAILARVEDLPSWVFFPDVERAEWMNKMVDQMWPFIGDYVQNLLMTTVQKTVQDSASLMGSFKFVKIDLGDIPPRIGGVKVYTEKVKRDEMYMDLDIIYSSDCEIEVKLKGMTAGIKDLQLHGTVRVIFKPLINQVPFFGGLSVFFMNNPSIDFNLTSLANALDLPGLNDMLQTIILENIANIMVLPNRIVVPMAQGLQISKLRFPEPDGVLRIHVQEAKELKKADISLLGKGKSDPYAVVRVGAMKFKTHVIDNSVTPKWNRVFETVIDEKDGQFMDIEVKDEDPGEDDKLGNVSIELSPVAEKGTVDNWLPLENVKSGKLHLKLVWLYLSKDPQVLNKQIAANKKDGRTKDSDDLSSCVLMVTVDSARELPRSRKMDEPSPYVIVNVGQKTEESKIVYDSTEPRWEQGFRFLVNDPNFQTVDFKIMDKKSDKQLGEMTYPLKNLLVTPDMEVDRFFPLKKAEGGSELSIRLSLRVLTTEQSPEWQDESENLMTETIANAKETDLDEATVRDAPVAAVSSTKTATSPGSEQIKPVSGQAVRSAPAPAPVRPIPSAKSSERDSEVRQRNAPSVSSTESNLGAHRLGRMQVTLRYSMQSEKLIVVLHKCVCLLACDKDNFSDPYVKMYLLPDKGSSGKRKTKVINNNLNPVFDETFEYSVSQSDLPSRSLEITVKNDTSMFSSSRKELGVVLIDMSQMDTTKALTEWYDLASGEDMKKETDI